MGKTENTETKETKMNLNLERVNEEIKDAGNSIVRNLEAAVATMESALEKARYELNAAKRAAEVAPLSRGFGRYALTDSVKEILHVFAWGMANATSDIEAANAHATVYATCEGMARVLEVK